MTETSPLVFGRSAGHEQVVFCHDVASGLKAIIAIHSTALGPSLGGTRFYPYASEEAALEDVLHLSRGMTYKNALAGLDHGGGKAVILGDPKHHKTETSLRAYGRFVASLSGRYITACDVGTYVTDMDVVARDCRWVVGRSRAEGGAGDSSVLTAFGVYQGMRACAERLWGSTNLSGHTVGIAGVGKVGSKLAGLLLDEGASVVVTDISGQALSLNSAAHPEVKIVADIDALLQSQIDIYAPCALGGALNDQTVEALADNKVAAVCGGANNQLDHPGIEKSLDDAGILYAPDYVVNSGGVIQVADELRGFSFDRAKEKAARIYDTTRDIFALATDDGVPPAVAADRLAEQRITAVSRLRDIHLDR
jgi:valine dehydrogenase (NAD+)